MRTLKAILVVLFVVAVTTNMSAQKADTYKGQWSVTPTVGFGTSNWVVDGDKDLTDEGFDLHINLEFNQFVVGLEGRAGMSNLDKDFDVNNVAGFFNIGYRIPFSK